LKDACAVGRRRPDLADSTIGAHRRRLDRELDRLLDLKPIDGSHLRATIAVTASDKLLVEELFAFMERNASHLTDYFNLPDDQVPTEGGQRVSVEGAEIDGPAGPTAGAEDVA
jgi:hypothetical protein